MKKAGIIDYKCGNIRSLFNALDFIQADPILISTSKDFEKVSHIILPGVGAFEYCMNNLKHSNLIEPLFDNVFKESKPLLGICVGMQMLLESSSELGNHIGLGWINGKVEELNLNGTEQNLKIPHVGWNSVNFLKKNEYFNPEINYDFYFDHSYAAQNINTDSIAGITEYGSSFTSVIKQGNILASQFHHEKSQKNGINFLKLFLKL